MKAPDSVKVNVLMQVEGSPVSNLIGSVEIPMQATLDPADGDGPEVTARVLFDAGRLASALREVAAGLDEEPSGIQASGGDRG